MIEDKRKKLNDIDNKIIKLLKQRFLITKKIGEEKYINHLNIENSVREKEIISKIDSFKNSEIKEVYETIFKESKKNQKHDYFLIGRNVSYSLSPLIHSLFGLNDYNVFDGDLKKALKGNFKGVNITIPYKKDALKHASYLSDEVKLTGVCNALVRNGEKIEAYNTDYFALKELYSFFKIDFSNKKVLIIGNGATSKSVFYSIKDLTSNIIFLVRNEKCEIDVNLKNYQNYKDYNIIINTTPVGTNNIDDELIDITSFNNLDAVIDVVYNPLETALLRKAKMKNVKAINGLFMLCAQAYFSEVLFGRQIEKSKIREVYIKANIILNNIVLIGMPYSGKTTLAKMLSVSMSRDYIDIDEVLKGKGVTLKSSSESDVSYFREMEEKETINDSLSFNKIISPGGGIVENKKAMKHLKANGIIVFLNEDLNVLLSRVDSSRPLTNTKEKLINVYKKRLALYKKYSDIIIDGNINKDKVEEKVYEYLNNKWS